MIEIVNPDDPNRDLQTKRREYAQVGIPEYWIVDPQTQTITVLELQENSYLELGTFCNDDLVQSFGFKQLNLKVSEVFVQN